MAKTATKALQKPPATPPKQTAQRAAPAAPAAQANRQAPEPARKPVQTPAVRQQPKDMVSQESLNQLPDFMRQDVDVGKENIRQEDMDIPRLKLIQGLSKELQLYDGLKQGNFFHSATETIFDEPEGVRVVPVYFDRQYILWRPLEDGGGILARASDGVHWSPSQGEFTVKLDRKDGGEQVTWKLAKTVQESGLANWGTMNPKNTNSPPAATLMYNFLLAFPDYPDIMPAVLTFQRSSIKIGRKFMTKLKTVRSPLFGTIFNLSSFVDHNSASQDFMNINIVGAGLVQDKDQYDMYKGLYESLAGKGLNIRDVNTLQDEDAGEGDGAAPKDQPNY